MSVEEEICYLFVIHKRVECIAKNKEVNLIIVTKKHIYSISQRSYLNLGW